MLTLTRKTEYGLIALCHLARAPGKIVSARDIAEEHAVPLPLLMNVLKKLNRTGYVRSVRGARGGYELGIAPRQLSLAALIEAVEGPVHFVRCTDPNRKVRRCEILNGCFIRPAVVKVHQRMRKFLEAVTVADIAFDQQNERPLEVAKVVAR
jgi:Rrf2 family protein